MNTPNNKRKRESMERIEKVFIQLLQGKELDEISVSDLCKRAGLEQDHILCKLYRYLRVG